MQALDPTSDFPEKPLDSPEQQEAMKEMKDPAGGMAVSAGLEAMGVECARHAGASQHQRVP